MSIISELEGHISTAIQNIELVDHLIGSPVEPFMTCAAFSGFEAPNFYYSALDEEALKDFIFCAERSGFKFLPGQTVPRWNEQECEGTIIYFKMIKPMNGKTIYFNVGVRNRVLFEYELSNRLSFK